MLVSIVAIASIALLLFAVSPWSPFGSRGNGGGLLGVILGTADELQQWVGRQLLEIANDHLNPELHYERIDYQPPATVTLSNVTLDAGSTRLLQAASIRVTLAETPRRGQPIVIQAVTLINPVINIIENESGAIVGFDNLIKRGGGGAKEDGGSTRLADVFEIREIKVENAALRYAPVGEPEMQLDGLTASLLTQPDATRQGSWYSIDCTLGRAPLAQLALDGALELNELVLALDAFEFIAELSPGNYAALPPSLQTTLSEHEVQGEAHVTGSGEIPLRDARAAQLSMQCTLENGRFVVDEFQVPVQSASITAALADQSLSVQSARVLAWEGQIDIAGSILLAERMQYSASVEAINVDIEKFSTASTESPDRSRGLLDVSCRVSGVAASDAAPRQLSGNGALDIRNAQLAKIPVIDRLLKVMKRISTYGDPTDRGDADFELHSDRIHLTQFEFISQSVAARGDGDVYYNGALDLTVNAGPLERIQGALGKIGDVFGKITDRLVSYKVTGTLDEPQYEIRPLGVQIPFLTD